MAETYSPIKGNGPPTKDTPGSVGQEYIDTDTGYLYECVEAFVHKGYGFSREIYNWEQRGISMDFMATDAEVADAIGDLRKEITGGSPIDGTYPVYIELVQ